MGVAQLAVDELGRNGNVQAKVGDVRNVDVIQSFSLIMRHILNTYVNVLLVQVKMMWHRLMDTSIKSNLLVISVVIESLIDTTYTCICRSMSVEDM